MSHPGLHHTSWPVVAGVGFWFLKLKTAVASASSKRVFSGSMRLSSPATVLPPLALPSRLPNFLYAAGANLQKNVALTRGSQDQPERSQKSRNSKHSRPLMMAPMAGGRGRITSSTSSIFTVKLRSLWLAIGTRFLFG